MPDCHARGDGVRIHDQVWDHTFAGEGHVLLHARVQQAGMSDASSQGQAPVQDQGLRTPACTSRTLWWLAARVA